VTSDEADLPDLSTAIAFDVALREAPVDVDLLTRAVERAHAALADARRSSDDAATVRVLGYLGNVCRVLGRHDEAIAALTEAVTRARASGDHRANLVNRLRLGEAKKYRGDVTEAENIFRQALRDAREPSLTGYHDFALQHLGKCRLEQGDAAEAVLLFEQALALRQRKGDQQLIASTEIALARALAVRSGQVEQ